MPLLTFVFPSVEWAQERLAGWVTEGSSETVHVIAAGLAWDGFVVPRGCSHELSGHVD